MERVKNDELSTQLPPKKLNASKLPILNLSKLTVACTAQKMKFSIKDFFSKCDQIRWKM